MPRAAQRHVMHHCVGARLEAQYLDRFSAKKRHARDIGLGVDARFGELRTQVGAHPGQDRSHSASGGGGTVKLTPESASKTASFKVSNANSSDCPFSAFDAAGTRATNSCSAVPDSALSSAS